MQSTDAECVYIVTGQNSYLKFGSSFNRKMTEIFVKLCDNARINSHIFN